MTVSNPVFALQGIGGVYNYGCEAIVRGTTAILRHEWPDCRILYASPRLAYDPQALEDLRLEFVSTRARVPLANRVVNKMLRVARLPWRLPVRRYYDWLEQADCVLSIGGDLFTMSPGDESRRSFVQAEHARYIMHSGKPLVLWGASVGPFDANRAAVKAYTIALLRMNLITARERLTVEYLKKLGIERNVRLVADPAFVMDADDSHAVEDGACFSNRPVLGVNLSPLSAKFAAYEEGTSGIPERQTWLLTQLLASHDIDIVLVPHVIDPDNAMDNDYQYLSETRERVDGSLRSRVRLLPPTLGARRTKWVISRCRALVAARMHCAIAGVSSMVPTLFLSYSRKAQGMCDYVYGNQDWVLPVSAEKEQLVSVVERLFACSDGLREHLSRRQAVFRSDAMKAGVCLREALS